MGVPQNGWFIVENPNLKWMITRGTPISGNLHMKSNEYIGLSLHTKKNMGRKGWERNLLRDKVLVDNGSGSPS